MHPAKSVCIVHFLVDLMIHNSTEDTKGHCFTVSNVPLKIEDFGNLFEYLPSTCSTCRSASAFISNTVEVSNEMLCVNYLCEPPENLKTISATPLDDWNERLRPFIKDYKLEVIIMHILTSVS